MPNSDRGETGGWGTHSREPHYVFLTQLQRNPLNYRLSSENRWCSCGVHWEPSPPSTTASGQFHNTGSFEG